MDATRSPSQRFVVNSRGVHSGQIMTTGCPSPGAEQLAHCLSTRAAGSATSIGMWNQTHAMVAALSKHLARSSDDAGSSFSSIGTRGDDAATSQHTSPQPPVLPPQQIADSAVVGSRRSKRPVARPTASAYRPITSISKTHRPQLQLNLFCVASIL